MFDKHKPCGSGWSRADLWTSMSRGAWKKEIKTVQQTNYFLLHFFSFLKVHIKIINLLSYFLSIIKMYFSLFFFFFFDAVCDFMNFCIPTFDFCAAGFPTRCQFDRLTEGFWPQNHKLLWPLTGGGRWPFIRGKIYRKTPRGEWKWPLMGGDRSSEVTVSGGSTVYVHSIKRGLYRFLLTRLDYCICNWSADYDDCFTF